MNRLFPGGSTAKIKEIASHEAPVARLCRIRRFPTSLFYGFFLRGDPKKLGYVLEDQFMLILRIFFSIDTQTCFRF